MRASELLNDHVLRIRELNAERRLGKLLVLLLPSPEQEHRTQDPQLLTRSTSGSGWRLEAQVEAERFENNWTPSLGLVTRLSGNRFKKLLNGRIIDVLQEERAYILVDSTYHNWPS